MMSGQEDADEVVGRVTSLSSSEQTNSSVISVLSKVRLIALMWSDVREH